MRVQIPALPILMKTAIILKKKAAKARFNLRSRDKDKNKAGTASSDHTPTSSPERRASPSASEADVTETSEQPEVEEDEEERQLREVLEMSRREHETEQIARKQLLDNAQLSEEELVQRAIELSLETKDREEGVWQNIFIYL